MKTLIQKHIDMEAEMLDVHRAIGASLAVNDLITARHQASRLKEYAQEIEASVMDEMIKTLAEPKS